MLALMAVVAATVAPALGGWGRGRRLANAADEVAATVRWARMNAITAGVACRVETADGGTRYGVSQLDPAGEWQPVAGAYGAGRTVGDGITLTIARSDGQGEAIDLLPNGRISPVRLTLEADWGERVVLACDTAAGSLRPVADGGTP